MIRLAIRVSRDQAEVVLAELLELAPSGVEEVDVSPDVVEYAVYGPPGELPTLPDVQVAAGGALVEVTTTEIADDWHERWREFHRPLVLDGLTVRPPWEPAGAGAPDSTSIEIVIDPAQAFGTGAHATTRLCLELLLDLPRGGSLLDLGCGSGVLAIAAARLGYVPVTALDYDPASVEATVQNAAVNGVPLDVRRHDLRHAPTPHADTITANLLGPLLIDWAAELARPDAVARPRTVIASGLLGTEAGRVSAAFAVAGFAVVARRDRAEWAALQLARA